MTGFLSQITSLVSSIKETVKQAVVGAKYIVSIIPYDYLQDLAAQFMQGFFRIFDPTIYTSILQSRRSMILLKDSFTQNIIFYLGLVLFYEAGLKPLLRSIPYVEMEEYQIEHTLFFMLNMHIQRMKFHRLIDNAANKISLAKIINEEHPNNAHYPDCGCGIEKSVQADISSIVYNVSNYAEAWLATLVLRECFGDDLGNLLGFLIWSLVYGQSLVEAKIASSNVCTKHRYIQLSQNVPHNLGIGLSFQLAVKCLAYQLSYLTKMRNYCGVESESIEVPLSNVLLPIFLVATLTMKHPLPGRAMRIDIFFHGHAMTHVFLMQAKDFIASQLIQNNPRRWMTMINQISQFPPIKFGKYLI